MNGPDEMHTETEPQSGDKTAGKRLNKSETPAAKALVRLAGVTATLILCLFGSAGTIAWLNGWVFLFSYTVILAALSGVVFRASPELMKERMSAASKSKAWDRILVPILAMILPLLAIVLAGLDHRFGWTSSIGMVEMISALMVMFAGSALTIWAMRTNQFFSSHVRIQSDRGHYVIHDGPYRWVRHPGYAGSILYNLAAPILLGSFASLLVGVVFTILMAIRTALEDSTLQAELDGYREYAAKIRWRLIPFLW